MDVEAADAATGVPPEVMAAVARSCCVLPVQNGGKLPLIANWTQNATADVRTVEQWARNFPGCNWGLLTGHRSGVFVLDRDGEAAERELIRLEKQGKVLPQTLTVITGRGKHDYFRLPDNFGIRNSAGRIAPGLDIRGEGGFVVMPPSRHESGHFYSYANPHAEPSDAPRWLLDLVASPLSSRAMSIRKGHRNSELTRIAGRHRRRGSDREQLEGILLRENERLCHPPLDTVEVLSIVTSVMRYAPKGADILDIACEAMKAEGSKSYEAEFRGIIHHLARLRPKQPIALPLERIAGHIGCNWTLIRRFRQRAILAGVIVPFEAHVVHRKAATFLVPGYD